MSGDRRPPERAGTPERLAGAGLARNASERRFGEHDDMAWFGLEELPPPAHERVRTALVEAMRSQRGWYPRLGMVARDAICSCTCKGSVLRLTR